jgi:hypothetical protein
MDEKDLEAQLTDIRYFIVNNLLPLDAEEDREWVREQLTLSDYSSQARAKAIQGIEAIIKALKDGGIELISGDESITDMVAQAIYDLGELKKKFEASVTTASRHEAKEREDQQVASAREHKLKEKECWDMIPPLIEPAMEAMNKAIEAVGSITKLQAQKNREMNAWESYIPQSRKQDLDDIPTMPKFPIGCYVNTGDMPALLERLKNLQELFPS